MLAQYRTLERLYLAERYRMHPGTLQAEADAADAAEQVEHSHPPTSSHKPSGLMQQPTSPTLASRRCGIVVTLRR